MPRTSRTATLTSNQLTDLGNVDPISGFPVYKALLCDVVPAAEETTGLVTVAGTAAGEDELIA